jgi:Sulfotransferase family
MLSSLLSSSVATTTKINPCIFRQVGCAMFNLLFRLLRLMHPSMTHHEAQHLVESQWFKNEPAHHQLDKAQLQEMLVSANWTKAVFYRDPVARFVSAFRSKCEGFDVDGDVNCHEAFGNETIPLPQALYQMTHPATHAHITVNAHFTPMIRFCGGLDQTLHYYDLVQPLEPRTVGTIVEALLVHVGVDNATKHALITEVVDSRGRLGTDLAHVQERFGLEPAWGVDDRHNTHSTRVLDRYMSTPEAMQIVEDFYASDYALFRLPRSREKKFCPRSLVVDDNNHVERNESLKQG